MRKEDQRFYPTKLGLALVDGYEAMGSANLMQPALRSEQEQDCRAIASNTRQKDDVLREQKDSMKLIFHTVCLVPLCLCVCVPVWEIVDPFTRNAVRRLLCCGPFVVTP